MVQLGRNPIVVQLASDLGLSTRGDCVAAISERAIGIVEAIRADSPITIDNLDVLRRIVANKYRVKIDVIECDEDIERITTEQRSFHPHLGKRLREEFRTGTTEGITLERDEWRPRDPLHRYLAVVDARGDRWARAYFTTWHELAHLVTHPEQLPFPGFRRTPRREVILKDPIESVVDHVAGRLAFFPDLFRPALHEAIASNGGLTFAALDCARSTAAPGASLFATAMGSLRLTESPALFVSAEMAFKADERRALSSGQHDLGLGDAQLAPKLRVTNVVATESAKDSGLAIRRNMRVPSDSAIATAFFSSFDFQVAAEENQAGWATSKEGTLPALPLRVEAVRRGRFVYGLISVR